MAVYRRSYRAYTGAPTAAWARFLVIARFALLETFDLRFLAVFTICFTPFVVQSLMIYMSHNAAVSALLPIGLSIDAAFFLRAVRIQGFFAFVLAAWAGPGLVAPDLANGAIPLYLCRPISRVEYVAGKIAALLGLLSLVTWVPNLLLFFLQATLETGWASANLRIAAAILLGSLLWIALLSLVALASSATVKRRHAASLLLVSLLFGGTAFGEVWREVLGNAWGRLANLRYLVELVWYELFGLVRPRTIGGVRMDRSLGDIPTWAAWAALLTICAACLWLLDQRVRAKETA